MSNLQFVTTQNRINSASEGRANKNTQVVRWPIVFGTDAEFICLSFSNFASTNAGEAATGNAYTVEECFIEIGGVVRQFKFSAVNSKLIPNDAVNILTDEMDMIAQFGSKPLTGSQGWIKVKSSVATAGATTGKLPFTARSSTDVAGSQASWYNSVADETIVSSGLTAGAYTVTSGTAFDVRSSGISPLVLGRPTANSPVFVAIGDSIAEGAGDSLLAGINGRSWVHRSTHDAAGTGNFIPCFNMGRTGNNLDNVIGTTNRRWENFIQYAPNGSLWIGNYGTNDIGSGGGGVLVDIQAKLSGLVNRVKTANSTFKWAWMLLMPRTASASDNWVSIVDQTPFPEWGTGQKSEQQNTWLQGQVGTLLDGVLDTSAVREPTATSVFLSNGTNDYMTADGTHLSPVANEFLAVAMRTLRASLISATPVVANPTISPNGGTYSGSTSVTLATATSGADIRYTTDGSSPTSSSTLYTAPITISVTGTLKVKAFKAGSTDSAEVQASFTINAGSTVATPTISPNGGTFADQVSVTLATATSGAEIRYTTNGSSPTSSSTLYDGNAILISSTATLKAKAFKAGSTDSSEASATFTITVTPANPSTGNTQITAIPAVTISNSISQSITYNQNKRKR